MLLALFVPTALAGLLINEVVYRTSGTDAGNEWIELCNNGSSTVDLTGYELQVATSASWSEAYTFASGTLAPGAYLVIGGGSSTHAGTFSPELGNVSSDTDGVRLVDTSDATVDTLLYGTPNSDGLTDDDGRTDRLGPSGTDDQSVARATDCVDTDDASADFVIATTPTRGATNGGSSSGDEVDCTGSSSIVINELMADPDGTDSATTEWVELANTGGATVDLSGWTFEWAKSSWTGTYTLPDGTTLAAGGYLLLGAGGLAVSGLDLGNAGSSADGVRVRCESATVDTVIYGTTNSDGLEDDAGVATSLAPKPSSGKSLARVPDGVDTDRSGDDFESSDSPTPGAENESGGGDTDTDSGGSGDCDGGFTINEFAHHTGAEFVEILNTSGGDQSLAGLTIQWGTSSYRDGVELPDVTLGAGEFFLVATAIADADLVLDLGDMPNATSNADGLRLACGDDVLDTVIYAGEGAANEDGWTNDDGSEATTFAPRPGTGKSSARRTDGVDTDDCGADFAEAEPTPGAPNPAPPVCDTSGIATVKVNELLYNPDSTDTDNEWVEIVNAGSAAVRLDAWTIETATSEWAADFSFPSGVELAPGAFLVVGGPNVSEADYESDDLSLGNGTRADGVRIVACDGTVVDSVLYGEDLDDPITGDGGSTEVVPDVDEAQTIGRFPDGSDTDAAADWIIYSDPTPGEPNTDPDDDDDGGDKGAGGDVPGCGGAPTDGARPDGGCATAMPLGGLEVLAAAIALARRRRPRA